MRTMDRLDATPSARQAVQRLRADRHGRPVMFVQSAGCCAGSVPMCFPDGEFVVGSTDVYLGDIEGCPFYIDKRLDEAWHHDEYVLDVAAGEAPEFSLAAGDGRYFVTRRRPHPVPPGPGPAAQPCEAGR